MKRITTAVAALALTIVMTAGPAREAKADGGAVAIGVGVYLLADHLVGRECGREEWPLNIIRKIGDELRGRHGCYRGHHHKGHHGNKDKYK